MNTSPSEPGRRITVSILNDIDGTAVGMRIIKQDPTAGGIRYYDDFTLSELSAYDTLVIAGTNSADEISIEPEVAKYYQHITVNSLGGNDVVDFGDYSNTGPIILVDTTINAGSGDDTIIGTPVIDVVWVGDGADSVMTGEGDDELHGEGRCPGGGHGIDLIYGDAGSIRFMVTRK
jgi:Ca2+-binding RTX toxin-like protein